MRRDQECAAQTEAARASMRSLLNHVGIDAPDADATVSRHDSSLTITLIPGVSLDPIVADTAAMRALAAVRAIAKDISIIDVAVARVPAPPVATV